MFLHEHDRALGYVRLSSVLMAQSRSMATPRRVDLETLSIIRLGSNTDKVKLLRDRSTTDAIRLAFKDDANGAVRVEAVRCATSDMTRLAFKDDVAEHVR